MMTAVTGKTILLVEDNPDHEALAMRALRKHIPANILVARDGEEALHVLLDSPTGAVPDLVLLDLQLPKIDGLEVLKRIRADARVRFVPVVVLTSSDEEQDIVSSYSLGANSYIRKPVDFQTFTDATRQLGLYWLELNQPATARRQ
jgi:two-component system response regulator